MLSFSNLCNFLFSCVVPIVRGNWLPDHFGLWTGCTVTRSRQSGSLRRDHQCLIGCWVKRWEQDFSSWLSLPALDISPLALPLPGLLLHSLLFGLLHIFCLRLSFLFVTFPPTIIAYSYTHIHNIPIFKILSHRASLNLTVEQQSWIGSSPSFGGFVGIIYHMLYMHNNAFNLVPALVHHNAVDKYEPSL